MDRFDRIMALHKQLSGARLPISHSQLEQALECSPATLKRTIEHMRNFLNAPIKYEREKNGYYYDHSAAEGGMFELPGLWFNASELQALLTMRELLHNVQPGLFDTQLAPLGDRIDKLLKQQQAQAGSDDIARRVRILGIAQRAPGEHFETIAGAVVTRRKIRIDYHGRARDRATARELSPQRLVHYRDGWYLDAWCHLRKGLRVFALERIRQVTDLKTRAKDIPEIELNDFLSAAFGIFAGPATQTARVRFTPERARWVAHEQWHPQQQAQWCTDGSYELRIPYGNPTELIMDLLRHGAGVEVIAPAALRDAVRSAHEQAAQQYGRQQL